jgi:hypothetical protein
MMTGPAHNNCCSPDSGNARSLTNTIHTNTTRQASVVYLFLVNCHHAACSSTLPTLPNGAFTCGSSKAFGDTCSGECATGYSGAPSTTCQADGKWPAATGACTPNRKSRKSRAAAAALHILQPQRQQMHVCYNKLAHELPRLRSAAALATRHVLQNLSRHKPLSGSEYLFVRAFGGLILHSRGFGPRSLNATNDLLVLPCSLRWEPTQPTEWRLQLCRQGVW